MEMSEVALQKAATEMSEVGLGTKWDHRIQTKLISQ